jgi:putative DNA primase/helicase
MTHRKTSWPLDEGLKVQGIVGEVVIEGTGDMAAICDQVEELLIEHETPIFQRGGMLVRVIDDGARVEGLERDVGAPRIVPYDDVSLCDAITRHLAIWKRNRKTDKLARVDCPRLVAQTILSRKEWGFRPLEAVVEHPVMLPDGQVLWESGYHKPTGLLLQLPHAAFQSPLDDPSEAELDSAVQLLCELLSGFDFVDDVDRSVAIALLLTSFVRPVLPTCPAFAIDAHAAGSGKSTLVRTQAKLATGREPAFLTYRDDPAELHKLLFACLLAGDQNIAVDNVDLPLSGADLAVILTSSMYRGRVLGQSVNASVPTKAVITFNGNNLLIVGDLTRRVLVSRLDPTCERPAERVFDFNPLLQVSELRSDYVLAALTIMQGYVASGERVNVRPFGSFEEWSRLVREPLVWVGLPDPVDSIRVLEAADPERGQLRAMLTAVHAVMGVDEFKGAALIQAAKAKSQASIDSRAMAEGQAEHLAEALHAVCERNGELNSKALGKWFLRMNGRIDAGRRFTKGRETNTGLMWRIEVNE